MERFVGIFGIILILGIAFAFSNNKKAISLKTVIPGLILQVLLAVFILKVPVGKQIFHAIGMFIQKILDFSKYGRRFCIWRADKQSRKDGGTVRCGRRVHFCAKIDSYDYFHFDSCEYSLLLRHNAASCCVFCKNHVPHNECFRCRIAF